MPEYLESYFAGYVVKHFLEKERCKTPPNPLTVYCLWADLSLKETQHSTHSLGKQGFVFKIDPSFQYLRGSRAHQTPIWPPPTLVDIPQGSTDLTASGLVLQGVEQNPRNVIMDWELLGSR
ncbi:hypothetical protein M422DRAFT_272623 [Sphaerobolus stellatus SS14]|uniref:Uncharacterized protein n=1 Tax=Sphaerobolus stellatus (strain SS14) TaxID=990650 RepID=A0A0C9ULL5_SPHS4|nr:hypothetical protein M422DRAFT_272623 [Sphaerobolus stellatus SS14]